MKEEEKGLVLFTGLDEALVKAEDAIVSATVGSYDSLESLEKTYLSMSVENVEDLPAYTAIVDGAKKVKSMRIAVDNKRKEITKPAIDFRDNLKSKSDAIIARLKPIEEHLLAEKKKFDDKKKAIEDKLFADRTKDLAGNGYKLVGTIYMCGAIQVDVKKIVSLTQDEFAFYINEGKKELARVAAEEKRKADEKAAMYKRLAELEAREKEIAAREAALKEKEVEVKAQANALEETYEKVEKEEVQPKGESEPVVKKESAPVVEKKDAPKQPEKTVTKEEPFISSDDYQDGFDAGFNDMRNRLVQLLSGTQKFTRADIVKWATEQNSKS